MCGPFSVKMLREKTSNSIPVHFELECYPSNTVSNFDFLKQQLRLKELPAKHWRSQSSRRLRRCSDILPPSLSFCCWSLFLLVLRYMSKWLCLGFVFRHCFYSSSGVLIWEEQQRKEPSRTSFISHSWFQNRRGASIKVCLPPVQGELLFKVCPVLVSFPRKLGQCWPVSHLWSPARPLVHRQVVFIMY